MRRSLLRVSKTVIFILAAIVFSGPYFSNAQDMRPVRADQKTITDPKKKKKHKRHVEITHGSDDDKKLREIKAEKNKQKAKK
jgi:hypothetical protein